MSFSRALRHLWRGWRLQGLLGMANVAYVRLVAGAALGMDKEKNENGLSKRWPAIGDRLRLPRNRWELPYRPSS